MVKRLRDSMGRLFNHMIGLDHWKVIRKVLDRIVDRDEIFPMAGTGAGNYHNLPHPLRHSYVFATAFDTR